MTEELTLRVVVESINRLNVADASTLPLTQLTSELLGGLLVPINGMN